jgi:hypothetical protein
MAKRTKDKLTDPIQVRLDDKMKRDLEFMATRDGRSLSGLIRWVLKRHLETESDLPSKWPKLTAPPIGESKAGKRNKRISKTHRLPKPRSRRKNGK